MLKDGIHKKLLLTNEILKAQITIREYYIDTAIREIYENIGQKLSLVHFELSAMALSTENIPINAITKSSKDIGQSIRDLRSMAKYFSLGLSLSKGKGYIDCINHIAQTMSIAPTISVAGQPKEITEEVELLLTNIMLKILTSIHDHKNIVSKISLRYDRTRLQVTILHTGPKIDWTKVLKASEGNTNLLEMNFLLVSELIKAEFSSKSLRDRFNFISLKLPFTLPFYE